MCECIEKIDEMLKPHNTKLGLTVVFGQPVTVFPSLETEQIEKGRGKPKAKAMLPSFCPFCGTKYEAAS